MGTPFRFVLPRVAVLACMLALPHVLVAQGGPTVSPEQFTDLTDLSLEEMLDVEVSLVTGHAQRIGDAAASVHVITRRDIERSGMTSIPELLRLVPGVHVQRIAAGRWAIGTRGQPGQFTNNLLVLMDGRSVYTPLFSGTYWDMQDLVLDDIERIEVIRGPGGARWGANAVNGVVNVVTRNAAQTHGTFYETIVGTEDKAIFSFRHGFALDESTDARVSGKVRERDSQRNADDTSVGDGYRSGLLDFRLDGRLGAGESWTLRGGLLSLEEDTLEETVTLTPPFSATALGETRAQAGHLLWRYEVEHESGGNTRLQVYYDAFDRDWQPIIRERRHTADVELQHRLRPWGDHRFTAGAGYRITTDRVTPSATAGGDDLASTHDIASAFLHDEWRLCDSLRGYIGAKLEYNDFTGLEVQPEARLAWELGQGCLIWGSVSRAVRTPNRASENGIIDFAASGGGPGGIPIVQQIRPNKSLQAETLIAYELGSRGYLTKELVGDLNLFAHDYDGISAYAAGTPTVEPSPPRVVVPLTPTNAYSFLNYGVEALLTWRPREQWSLSGGYSWIGQDLRSTGGADSAPFGFGHEPSHQAMLRIGCTPVREFEVNVQAFYYDAARRVDVDPFVRLDVGLTWKPDSSTSLSIVGKDLLDDRHPEAVSDLFTVPGEVERSVHLMVSHRF